MTHKDPLGHVQTAAVYKAPLGPDGLLHSHLHQPVESGDIMSVLSKVMSMMSPVGVPVVGAGGEARPPVPHGLRANDGQRLADGRDDPGPHRRHLNQVGECAIDVHVVVTDLVIIPVLGSPDEPRHDLRGGPLVTLPVVPDHRLHVGADHVQETVTEITKQGLPHPESRTVIIKKSVTGRCSHLSTSNWSRPFLFSKLRNSISFLTLASSLKNLKTILSASGMSWDIMVSIEGDLEIITSSDLSSLGCCDPGAYTIGSSGQV